MLRCALGIIVNISYSNQLLIHLIINCKQVYPQLLFNTLFNTYLIATFALAIS